MRPDIVASCHWDFTAAAVVQKHNLVSCTRIGAGAWEVLTSYVPRDTTTKARGDLAKIRLTYSTQDSNFITANAVMSGGKMLINVSMGTFAGVATDGDFMITAEELP